MSNSKKKHGFFSNPMWIVGGVTLAGAFGTAIVTLAGYITLPKRVEAVEQKTDKIEQYIEKQQLQNELLQQIVTQDNQKQIIISPDGAMFFNENKLEWRPIKELQAYKEGK